MVMPYTKTTPYNLPDTPGAGAEAELLAPWGSPPTPILPHWHFETLYAVELPAPLRKIAGPEADLRLLGDLADLWQHRTHPLGKDEHSALVRMAYRIVRPPDDFVAIPEGIDTAVLFKYPLRARTLNCLRQALNADMYGQLKPITLGQLFKLRNFGLVSLLDLTCVVEAALERGLIRDPAFTPPLHMSPTGAAGASTLPEPEPPDPSSAAWGSAVPVLKRLLAASSAADGRGTLADGLNSSLGALAVELGMGDSLADIAISDLCGTQPLAEEVLASMSGLWKSLEPLDKAILRERLLSPEPQTLEQLGQAAGLTRERIRQIENIVKSRLRHPSASGPAVLCWIAALGVLLRNQLGPITDKEALESRISATFPLGEYSDENGRAAAEMARHLLREDSGYSTADSACLSQTASDAISELKAAVQDLADEVGLVAESDLMARLPDDSWRRHWDQLIALCGLHRLCGHLALRDTANAKAKAAVLFIGHPATKEEIGEVCGLEPNRLGARLSAIPGVIRADKRRWGLAEWIEDEYEGIPAEIIQRIEEDGGATRLERLLEELPRMFDVAEGSVEAYAKSARFRISDGYVSVADPSSITLRALVDVIHGRTFDGLPFWSFKVEGRYFDGYSLAGLPPEIADALGCEPDGSLRVPVLAPKGCGTVSVRWPLTSLTGATLGYLAEPLRQLGARQSERIHLVLEASCSISLRRPSQLQPSAAQPEGSDDSSERAKELLERMKERRRGL